MNCQPILYAPEGTRAWGFKVGHVDTLCIRCPTIVCSPLSRLATNKMRDAKKVLFDDTIHIWMTPRSKMMSVVHD